MQWVGLWDEGEKYHRKKQLTVTIVRVVRQDIKCYLSLVYDNTKPASLFVLLVNAYTTDILKYNMAGF